MLENVSPDGKELPGCQGRLTVPGHSSSLIVLSFRQFKKKAVCVIYTEPLVKDVLLWLTKVHDL